jgi:O-antigen/teichoic acid export membrane protein
MARVLGAELGGNILFISNTLYLFLLIGSLSFESGITYYVVKKEIPETILASAALLWSLVITLFISAGVFLFYKNGTHLFSPALLCFAAAAYTLGSLLTIYFTAFFYAHDDYKTPNLVLGSSNLLLLAFVPWHANWLGFVDKKIFIWLFFSVFLIQGLFIAGSWFIKNKQHIILKSGSIKRIAPALRYSTAALLGNVAYFLLYRIDYWFVDYYCSAKSLGNYIQVSRLGQLFLLLPMVIAGALFPQSAKEKPGFTMADIGKLAKQMIVLYSLLAFFIWLIGRPVISWLWGREYNEMFIPLLIIMPGILFLSVSYLFSPIFAGKGKVKYNVVIALITLGVVVTSDWLLIPAYGIKGAAIATSIGFFVMLGLYLSVAKRNLGFSLKHVV